MYYNLLIVTEGDGELIQMRFSAENIVDIRNALRAVWSGDLTKGVGECFKDTMKMVEKIPIPNFDY